MDDIGEWLERHGLGKYADAFRANDVGIDILADLDREDLRALGVSIGDQKRLLRAVDSMGDTSAGGPSDSPSETELPAVGPEHRQLSIMFCDLVGSVALGEQLHVEDYRDLLSRFRATVVDAVERYGGFVARHQGDGLLVYFGYPRADERDAERSVRAGLEVVRAVQDLASADGPQPQVRVGIATGPAVVGDVLSTGASSHSELAAMGSTPNLAARLQGVAGPDCVVISETTAKVVGQTFETETLEPTMLKGFHEPIAAFRVVGETRPSNAWGRSPNSDLAPLVGRIAELALLEDRWAKAEEGAAQVVLVSAEPGVGKSRLVREFKKWLRGRPATIASFQCSPYHTGTPLYPVAQAISLDIERRFGSEDSGRLDSLGRWIEVLGLDRTTHLPVLDRLTSTATPDGPELAHLAPDELRRRTLNTLHDLIEVQSREQPLVLVVEDLHWIDPTTEELLTRLLDSLQRRAVLALFTFRPGYSAPWYGRPNLTTLALNHLTPAECRRFLAALSGDQTLGEALVEQIVERADGVPLYVEELSRLALEHSDSAAVAIPATVRDALTARLDGLGPLKEVAQVASTIGRTFGVDLLQSVSGHSPETLSTALGDLVDSGLFRRTAGTTGDGRASYEFKHALIRDAAHESMLRERREELHCKLADILEAEFEDGGSGPPELVAQHREEANQTVAAIKWWNLAGTLAFQRSAYSEAASHLSRALEMLQAMASSDTEMAKAELEVCLRLGRTHAAIHGSGSDEVGRAYAHARSLARRVEDDTSEFFAERGLTAYHYSRGEPKEAEEIARHAAMLADRSGNRVQKIRAAGSLAQVLVFYRSPLEAHKYLESGLQMFGEMAPNDADYAAALPGVVSMASLDGVALTSMGRFREAIEVSDRARALAEVSSNQHSRAEALLMEAGLFMFHQRFSEVERAASETIDLADRYHLPHWLSHARIYRGCARALSGRGDGIDEAEQGLRDWRAIGSGNVFSWFDALVAEAHVAVGDLAKAEEHAARALALAERSGEQLFESLNLLVDADVRRASGDACSAEKRYRRAWEHALAQNSLVALVRIALRLAELERDRGEMETGRAHLVDALRRYAATEDIPPIVQARQLLTEIEA